MDGPVSQADGTISTLRAVVRSHTMGEVTGERAAAAAHGGTAMRKVWGRVTLSVAAFGCVALGAGSAGVGAAAPPPTGCQPTACTAGATVGLTNSQGQPIAGAAEVYPWGMEIGRASCRERVCNDV